MTGLSSAYLQLRRRLIAAAERDDRIVGLIDYGSTGEGRGDRWSDLDVAVFLRDDALEAFEASWRSWAAGHGDLLLAYVGAIGHPWAVYRAEPLPLRADFVFYGTSRLTEISEWPIAPTSVETAVWYDATAGLLSRQAAGLIGSSLGPDTLQGAFDRCCGDLWYYLLRAHAKLLRDQLWAARWELGFIILDNLMWLLRLEADAVGRWRASSAATELETAISAERLQQLDACIAGPGRAEVERALNEAGELAIELCGVLAQRWNWPWPEELAATVTRLLGNAENRPGPA